MGTSIRVIVEDGKFRPLEPIDFAEGQEMELMVLTERERVVAALGDRIVKPELFDEENFDEERLLKEIEDAFRGQPPLSDTLIEERREGP